MERDELDRESPSKRRRSDDAEEQLQTTPSERDAHQREIDRLKEQSERDLEVYAGRIKELEADVRSLKLQQEVDAADRALSARLKQWFNETQEERKASKALREEVCRLRAQVSAFEKEKAALEEQNAAIPRLEDAAIGAQRAKGYLAHFQDVAATIIALSPKDAAAKAEEPSGAPPTPVDLLQAWGKCERANEELKRQLAEIRDQEFRTETELTELRRMLSEKNLRCEELELECKKVNTERLVLQARVATLNEAIERPTPENIDLAARVAGDSAVSKQELDAAKRHAADAEAVAQEKSRLLEQANQDMAALRSEVENIRGVEARVDELKQANDVLRSSSEDLQRQLQASRQAEAEGIGNTVKVLHLLRKPGETAVRTEEQDESRAFKAEIERRELEHTRTVKQLQRFKYATKKYVMEFREGIYGVLGWKVEMVEDHGILRWHLTSRYQPGEDQLVFRLKPGGKHGPALFDLLSTPWGQRLQGNSEAMAYLDNHQSIPGFLAYVTIDLLSKRTLPE